LKGKYAEQKGTGRREQKRHIIGKNAAKRSEEYGKKSGRGKAPLYNPVAISLKRGKKKVIGGTQRA